MARCLEAKIKPYILIEMREDFGHLVSGTQETDRDISRDSAGKTFVVQAISMSQSGSLGEERWLRRAER
jgi:hypothetical protein